MMHAVARFDDCGVHLASERDVGPFQFAQDAADGCLQGGETARTPGPSENR